MKMKELGYISEEEYQEALKEDIKTELKPGRKKSPASLHILLIM